jgi:RimJ/RimL family protein N-acetyltransferase
MSLMTVRPTTLRAQTTRLEPQTTAHVSALFEAGSHPDLWLLQPTTISTVEDMRVYVVKALDEQQRGESLPFVIIDQVSSRVIGSTRYLNIAPRHRRLEVGCTWIAPAYQRTRVNTEAKLLLLTHAFETLEAIRVILKTDVLNQQSRAAILRLGAVEEGTFRQHLIADSGRRRDMIYFSILEFEWPAVRANLEAKLR